MPTQLSPQEFVVRWRNITLKERPAAQEHFINLCQLVSRTRRSPADFRPQLRQLFGAMATGGWFGIEKIVLVIGQHPALKPSPSPGRRARNPKTILASKPLPRPPASWSRSGGRGSIRQT